MSFKNFDFSMFDSEAGFQIGEAKASNNGAAAMGHCAFGWDCGGGGGECGSGLGCAGGGGQCGGGVNCAGGGGQCVVVA